MKQRARGKRIPIDAAARIRAREQKATDAKLRTKANDREKTIRNEVARRTEELCDMVDRIIQRASQLDWTRRRIGAMYEMRLSFDPRLIGMSVCPQDELRLLAARFGRQVEREIATSKFLASAEQSRAERMRQEAEDAKFWRDNGI